MNGIIIIDKRTDTGNGFMNKMFEDGALPEELRPLLEKLIGSRGGEEEFEKKPCHKFMWPEREAFPVDGAEDLILNNIYASAQEDQVPGDVMSNIKADLFKLLNNTEDIGSEVKTTLMKGSTKVYSKTLEDGTQVEVKITKSAAKKEDKIDTLKAMEVFNIMSMVNPEMKKAAAFCAGLAAHGYTALPKEGNFSEILDTVLEEAAKYGHKKEAVLKKIAEDESTPHKVVIGEHVIDSRRLNQYPYNSDDAAKKALSNSLKEMIYDNKNKSISLDKLKKLYSNAKSAQDPMLERVTDDVLRSLKYRESK